MWRQTDGCLRQLLLLASWVGQLCIVPWERLLPMLFQQQRLVPGGVRGARDAIFCLTVPSSGLMLITVLLGLLTLPEWEGHGLQ